MTVEAPAQRPAETLGKAETGLNQSVSKAVRTADTFLQYLGRTKTEKPGRNFADGRPSGTASYNTKGKYTESGFLITGDVTAPWEPAKVTETAFNPFSGERNIRVEIHQTRSATSQIPAIEITGILEGYNVVGGAIKVGKRDAEGKIEFIEPEGEKVLGQIERYVSAATRAVLNTRKESNGKKE